MATLGVFHPYGGLPCRRIAGTVRWQATEREGKPMQLKAQVSEGIYVDSTLGREVYRLHAGSYPVTDGADRGKMAGISTIEIPATLVESSRGATLDLPTSIEIVGWTYDLRPGAVVVDGLVSIIAIDGDEAGNPVVFHLEPADVRHRGRGIVLVSRETCRIAGDAPDSLHKVAAWGGGWISTTPAGADGTGDDIGDDVGTIRIGEIVRIMDPRGVLTGDRLTVMGAVGARFIMAETTPVR